MNNGGLVEYRIKTLALLVSGTLAAGSLVSGCASRGAGSAAQAAAAAAPAQAAAAVAPTAVTDTTAAPAAADRPGVVEGELTVVTAKVKAIDSKNRVVTLVYPDGRTAKIKCGPEVRNFAQIRVGDSVTAQFLESVEIFVSAEKVTPASGTASAVERAPEGGKPGITEVQSVEVTAVVESIDYKTRMVKLRGPEGKTKTVKAGPAVKRLDEVKQGDTVVVRYTEALSVKVTAPTETAPAKKK
jgi:hypothetical protein